MNDRFKEDLTSLKALTTTFLILRLEISVVFRKCWCIAANISTTRLNLF